MIRKQADYHVYLLRLWQVQQAGEVVWRASLEDPSTRGRIGFIDLNHLCAYFQCAAMFDPPFTQCEEEMKQRSRCYADSERRGS